jgi:tetratricopeptide (TPR) repeat protein
MWPSGEAMSRLFISHSSQNNIEAVALHGWLAAEGWNDVFLDLDPEQGIKAGERWERALNEAASRCEAVLFLVSREWLASRWCLKEFNLARKLNKRLFGILVETIAIEELPEDLTSTWQLVDLASGADHTLLQVTMPRTHEEAHVTFSKEGLTRLRGGLAKAGLDPRFFAWPPEDDPDRPPYRGLRPLEAEDAGIFFGRDAPIVEALDTLRGLKEGAAPRILVILGASGAGKSSFLRAGLLPRLVRDDRHFLVLPVVRPERAAINGDAGLLRALEAALASRGLGQSRTKIRETIAGGAELLRPLLRQLVGKAFAASFAGESNASPPAAVLAIDQAEELFSSAGAGEGEALLKLVGELVAEDDPAIIVLFTIRSDSYDRLETTKTLMGIRQQAMPLLPLPRGAYQIVVEGPAVRLAGTSRKLSIEPRLVQRLLEDVEQGGGSDALPLLAFTLEQLYLEYGGGGRLQLADYEAFGGMRGAIEVAVGRALAAAEADPRIPRDREARLALLRHGLIPWLAGIDPESGSPRRRIARLADIPAEALPLIRLLVEQRLLSTDRVVVRDTGEERVEITIEPAHEALLRQWGLLRGWLEEDFAALATLEGVKRAARDWAANGRREDWLNHAGDRLDDAEKVAARHDLAGDLTADAHDYLRECRQRQQAEQAARLERLEREREEQQRRLQDAQRLAVANRRTARRTGIGLFAALVLMGLAVWQWREADNAAREAKAQRDRAEQIFGLAVNETDAIVAQTSSQLKDLVGVSRTGIRSILAVIEEQFDNMVRIDADSPRLKLSRAKMLSAFVDIYDELGEMTEAVRRANQCATIMRPLASAQAKNPEMLEGLGLCLEKLGYSAILHGDVAEAPEAYRESIGLRRQVLAASPEDRGAKLRLGHALGYCAYALLSADKIDDAVAPAEESLAIVEPLAADQNDGAAQREYVESLNSRAMVLHAKGDPKGALPFYEHSRDLAKELLAKEPENATLRRFFSNLLGNTSSPLMALGRYEEARALLLESLGLKRRLIELDPDNTLWQRELGNTLVELGDASSNLAKPVEALAYYRESVTLRAALLAKDAGNNLWKRDLVISHNRIGQAYALAGDFDKALASYAEAVAIDPKFALTFANRGFVYYRKRDYPRAIADYNQALSIEPKFAFAYNGRGNVYWSQQDYDRAIEDYSRAIEIDPRYAVFFYNRANTYRAKEDYAHALVDYEKALSLAPNYAEAYNGRGLTLYFKSDYARAVEDFGKAIAVEPKNAVYYDNRAEALRAGGEFERSLSDYDQAIALDPKYSAAYHGRGLSHYFLQDYDRAIEDYTAAIKFNARYTYAYVNRGIALRAKADYSGALADLNVAIGLEPKLGRAYYSRGSVYRALGDKEHALADYFQAIVFGPKDAGAFSAQCFEHLVKGEFKAALDDCDHSLELTGLDAYALDGRGLARLGVGQYDAAIADFDGALKIEPKLASSLYGRGLAKQKKGGEDNGEGDIVAAQLFRAGVAAELASYGIR